MLLGFFLLLGFLKWASTLFYMILIEMLKVKDLIYNSIKKKKIRTPDYLDYLNINHNTKIKILTVLKKNSFIRIWPKWSNQKHHSMCIVILTFSARCIFCYFNKNRIPNFSRLTSPLLLISFNISIIFLIKNL